MNNTRFRGCLVVPFFLILTVAVSAGCQNQHEGRKKIRFSAVYFDLHGTLLDSEYRLRPATISVLERFRKCGGSVGIATGGTLEQVRPYLADIAPNLPTVLLNGALVVSAKEPTRMTPLISSVVLAVVEKTQSLPQVRGIILQNADSAVVDRDDPPFLKALKHFGISSFKVDKGFANIDDYRPLEIIIEVQKGQGDSVKKVILPYVAGEAEVIVSGPYSVDVVAAGVSKAGAVVQSLRSSSIEPAESMAFGDGDNDAEMLSKVGVGIAMKNCSPAACNAAVVTIGDNNSDAIAQFFEKVILTSDCQ